MRKIVGQVAHDIRSPLIALNAAVHSQDDSNKANQIALKGAVKNIMNACYHLLSYNTKKVNTDVELHKKYQNTLVSSALLRLLRAKEREYGGLSVTFAHNFSSQGSFAFIKVEPVVFDRMLSNLINNAVNAVVALKNTHNPYDGMHKTHNTQDANVNVGLPHCQNQCQQGTILLDLQLKQNMVTISVVDNGHGMSNDIKARILGNISATTTEQVVHGLGFAQVTEALAHNQGTLDIESILGKGTTVTLTFPKVKTPPWFVDKVEITRDDTIVIVTDNQSIYAAWDLRFSTLIDSHDLTVKHFTYLQEAISLINTLQDRQNSNKLLLLVDSESLIHNVNDLDSIVYTKVMRAILITSYCIDEELQKHAIKNGIKILPKELTSDVPIEAKDPLLQESFLAPINTNSAHEHIRKDVFIVIVDDDKTLVRFMIEYAFSNKTVDKYYDPDEFLANVSRYDKNTRICLDNQFKSSLTGVAIAHTLHKMGFTRIYILTGQSSFDHELPSYIKVISKDDLDAVRKLGRGEI